MRERLQKRRVCSVGGWSVEVQVSVCGSGALWIFTGGPCRKRASPATRRRHLGDAGSNLNINTH
jgi:hypothetical protein